MSKVMRAASPREREEILRLRLNRLQYWPSVNTWRMLTGTAFPSVFTEPFFLWGNNNSHVPLRRSIRDSEMTACCGGRMALTWFSLLRRSKANGSWFMLKTTPPLPPPHGRGGLVWWCGWSWRTLVWILTLLSNSLNAKTRKECGGEPKS